MTKITILGGAGFIGSHLIKGLVKSDYQVSVLDIAPCPIFLNDLNHNIEWTIGSILDPKVVRKVLAGSSKVIHLASSAIPSGNQIQTMLDMGNDISGLTNIIRMMSEEGVSQILFSSSGGTVYGDHQYLPLDEVHPTDPKVAYGVAKLTSEKYLLMQEYTNPNVIAKIARISNPYGYKANFSKAQGLIPVVIKKMLDGESIEIWGDGTNVRDYLYIDDLINGLIKYLEYDGNEKIMNLGSGQGYSVNEILGFIESFLRIPCHMNYLPSRDFDVKKNILSIEKAKGCLGWNPQVDIYAGIEKTVNEMKVNLKRL